MLTSVAILLLPRNIHMGHHTPTSEDFACVRFDSKISLEKLQKQCNEAISLTTNTNFVSKGFYTFFIDRIARKMIRQIFNPRKQLSIRGNQHFC